MLLDGLLRLRLSNFGHGHAELEIELFGTITGGGQVIGAWRRAFFRILIVDGFGRVHLSSSLRDLRWEMAFDAFEIGWGIQVEEP